MYALPFGELRDEAAGIDSSQNFILDRFFSCRSGVYVGRYDTGFGLQAQAFIPPTAAYSQVKNGPI
jgi:hypothetical protein